MDLHGPGYRGTACSEGAVPGGRTGGFPVLHIPTG